MKKPAKFNNDDDLSPEEMLSINKEVSELRLRLQTSGGVSFSDDVLYQMVLLARVEKTIDQMKGIFT